MADTTGPGYFVWHDLMTKDASQQQLLQDEGYVAFSYVDADGNKTTDYPANPNGSPMGCAGLTDVTGRGLGMMPHPDRAYFGHNMPNWTRDGLASKGEGMALFEAMVKVARAEA